jgi:hypothetical protein
MIYISLLPLYHQSGIHALFIAEKSIQHISGEDILLIFSQILLILFSLSSEGSLVHNRNSLQGHLGWTSMQLKVSQYGIELKAI